MNRFFIIIIFLFFFILPTITGAVDITTLKFKLNYLTSLPEISWVQFKGNDIIIGFNIIPNDLRLIMNAAALNGNRAYGSGVHLWAVHAEYKNWNVWKDPYICTATARYGKIEENNCR